MSTTVSTKTNGKKKKLVELPEDVIISLSVQAARESRSVKSFMENILIAAAKNFEQK